jgi:hypothetical protein
VVSIDRHTWDMEDTRTESTVGRDLLDRLRAEFTEMPGLYLTPKQAARLWALDSHAVETALAALVDAHFLMRTPRGGYRRSDR